jgi:hypothetical protein
MVSGNTNVLDQAVAIDDLLKEIDEDPISLFWG